MSEKEPSVESQESGMIIEPASGTLLAILRSLAIFFAFSLMFLAVIWGASKTRESDIAYLFAYFLAVGSVAALVWGFRQRHRTKPNRLRLAFYVIVLFWSIHYLWLNWIWPDHREISNAQYAVSLFAVFAMFGALFAEEMERWLKPYRQIDPVTGRYRTRQASAGKAHAQSLFMLVLYTLVALPVWVVERGNADIAARQALAQSYLGLLLPYGVFYLAFLAQKKHRRESSFLIPNIAFVFLQYLQAKHSLFPFGAYVALSLTILVAWYPLLMRSLMTPRTPRTPNWATQRWTWSWRTGFRKMK